MKLNLAHKIVPEVDFAWEYHKYGRGPVRIQIPSKGLVKGGGLLEAQFGVNVQNDKIACIFGRDSSYLKQTYYWTDWTYHDYRDIDINTCIKAIEYLIKHGYKVFRLGKIVSQPVNYQHPHFIDYALSKVRSDFLDVFLVYVSKIVIGTPAGITDLATVFDKPYLGIGYTPVFSTLAAKQALFIPKKMGDANTGKEIAFYELFDFQKKNSINFSDTHCLDRFGLKYIENTAEEIYLAVQEMIERIEGYWHPSSEDRALEQNYINNYWKLIRSHDFLESPIALSWLRLNSHLYFR